MRAHYIWLNDVADDMPTEIHKFKLIDLLLLAKD